MLGAIIVKVAGDTIIEMYLMLELEDPECHRSKFTARSRGLSVERLNDDGIENET